MDRLIDGANEKSLEITDVEKETFLRLVEFAYRGDYTVQPCPDSGESVQQPTAAIGAPPTRTEDQTGSTLATRWSNRQYINQPTQHEKIATRFSVTPHREFEVDHEAIFLLHAKLHCLAKRYDINPLMDLTLHKLHETLKHCATTKFVSGEARVTDIVALANYAYETNGSSDALRKEVLEYVVILLKQHDDPSRLLKILLRAEREFVVDMWQLYHQESVASSHQPVAREPMPVTPGQAPVTPVQASVTVRTMPMQAPTPLPQRPAASGQTPRTPTRQASVHGRHASTLDPRAPSYQPRK